MSRSAGYTFVELCTVIVVLGIVASASFLGVTAENQQRLEAQQERCAAGIAAALLERARADLEAARTGFDWTPTPSQRATLPGVTATLTFAELDRALTAVRSEVTWTGPAKQPLRRLVLCTWIAGEPR